MSRIRTQRKNSTVSMQSKADSQKSYRLQRQVENGLKISINGGQSSIMRHNRLGNLNSARTVGRSSLLQVNKKRYSITPFKKFSFQNNLPREKGTFGARKEGSKEGLSARSRSVLLTGGLQVRKGALLKVKLEGSNWEDRIVKLQNGQINIYDMEDICQCSLRVSELSDIGYCKRSATTFELVFRTVNYVNESVNQELSEGVSRRDTLRSKLSKFSVSSFASKHTHLLFSPKTKFISFKTACAEDTSSWIQVILYELRNQASFIDQSINVTLEQIRCSPTSEEARYLRCLDELYRQSVDLWSLARGRYSVEALKATVELRDFLKRQDEDEESELWQEVCKAIEEHRNQDVLKRKLLPLQELQELNELKHHCDNIEDPQYRDILNNDLKFHRNTRANYKTFRPIRKMQSAREIKDQKELEEERKILSRIHAAGKEKNQLTIKSI